MNSITTPRVPIIDMKKAHLIELTGNINYSNQV